ncbi:MAG: hypothetical protein H5T41_07945 [Methanomassiliicoccales archaeon]|nr:hypothetical protein [Methanomassiliicoccales archaeon]
MSSDACPTEGIGVLFRKKDPIIDQKANHIIHRSVYKVAEVDDGEESKRFKSTKVVYSFWSAVKYIFILSFLLWWLPIIGQMIAGYVGGRRAGSPWKGVMAAFIPLAIIFAITAAVDVGWIPTTINGINITPGAILSALASNIPLLDSYMNFASLYLHNFVSLLQSTISFRLDSYLMTIAFAYIGGIIADQTRREMEYISQHGGHRTTVVVEGSEFPHETVSPRPSWSSFSLRPRRQGPERMSFDELQALGASVEYGDEELPPLRSAHRIIESKESPRSMSPREAKLIDRRAHLMAKKQRMVEKKVKKSASLPEGLINRALMKKRTSKSVAPEKVDSNSGDWEFM